MAQVASSQQDRRGISVSTVVNKQTFEIKLSVNTPDYSPSEWLINPTIPQAPKRYWIVDGNELTIKDATGQATADAEYLVSQKESRKNELETEHLEELETRYPAHRREALQLLLTEAMITGNIERAEYIGQAVAWAEQGRTDLYTVQDQVDAAVTPEEANTQTLNLEDWLAVDPKISVRTAEAIDG
tara:strand:- start:13 stop:570 length:558 start_codon:yes stop_codon:yes gene_type:complete